jgi:hypothetical protein
MQVSEFLFSFEELRQFSFWFSFTRGSHFAVTHSIHRCFAHEPASMPRQKRGDSFECCFESASKSFKSLMADELITEVYCGPAFDAQFDHSMSGEMPWLRAGYVPPTLYLGHTY